MQAVGHHLQVKAHGMPKGDLEKDAFARSAYNRYYYACFLSARSILAEIDPEWSRAKHIRFPDLFKKNVRGLISAAKKKAVRLSDTELVAQLDAASRAAIQASEIMKQAYATRVVADYEPSIAVQFSTEGRFSLSGVDITKAHNWQDSLSPLLANIISTWRQINV